MVDGLNLFCKNKLKIEEVIRILDFEKTDVLFIENIEGWLERNTQNIVIEYNGIHEEDDSHPGDHYYNVSLFVDNIKSKFRRLENDNIIVDIG